jgi:two-component system, LuxR family, response regulator FixJ
MTTVPIVYLVDDDVSFLTATSRLLRASGFEVKTCSSAVGFLAGVAAGQPGCVIVDLEMPGMNGLDLQAAMARAGIALTVIFLTGRGDIPSTVRAMRQGAEDFMEKRAPKEQLIDAVRRALARNERERAKRRRSAELRNRLGLLSDREREVLAHVVQGKLNKQIAAALDIHERTVKLHRTAITTKLGVHSVADLTKLWIEAGAGFSDH